MSSYNCFVLILLLSCLACVISRGKPGARHQMKPKAANYWKNVVVKLHNERSNSLYHWVGVEVLNAERQVVSGFNIWMTIKFAETQCLKKDAIVDPEACKPNLNVS